MTYTDPDLEQDDDPENPGEGHDLRQLRDKAKRADKAETEAEELRAQTRELAFYKAGLTAEQLASPLGQMFVNGYSGDTDPEAIQVSWQAVSSPGPQSPEPPEDSTAQRQALSSDSTLDTGTVPRKPVRGRDGEAVKAGQAVLDAGGTRDEAMGTAFARLVDAAREGDQSVILTGGGVREQ